MQQGVQTDTTCNIQHRCFHLHGAIGIFTTILNYLKLKIVNYKIILSEEIPSNIQYNARLSKGG